MKRFMMLGAILAVATACTTQQELDQAPVQRSFTLSENYQVVYARLNKAMRACAFVPLIDAQLYSELGYAEITGQLAEGMPSDYAKISRNGQGATVELRSIRKAIIPDVREKSVAWLEYWSRGGTVCQQAVGYGIPPAA